MTFHIPIVAPALTAMTRLTQMSPKHFPGGGGIFIDTYTGGSSKLTPKVKGEKFTHRWGSGSCNITIMTIQIRNILWLTFVRYFSRNESHLINLIVRCLDQRPGLRHSNGAGLALELILTEFSCLETNKE